jgi:hypothetical protein
VVESLPDFARSQPFSASKFSECLLYIANGAGILEMPTAVVWISQPPRAWDAGLQISYEFVDEKNIDTVFALVCCLSIMQRTVRSSCRLVRRGHANAIASAVVFVAEP